MLRRFESIKNSGIFEDFCWDSAVPDFERINLIFGTNGVGKTSLSRAIDNLRSENGGSNRVSVRMSDVDGTNERCSNFVYDAEFERIFVFSDGYVARNHDFNGDPEVEAILTLGELGIEDGKRVEELGDLIAEVTKDLARCEGRLRLAEEELVSGYQTVSKDVVDLLHRAGGSFRARNTYSMAIVKKRFAESHRGWKLLSDKEKRSALAIINSDAREKLVAKSYSYVIRPELLQEVCAVLAVSPVSVLLDTLKAHEEASSWVDSGRRIHQELSQCIFCGGDLSDDRKTQIARHFSNEVEDVQRNVIRLISEVTKVQVDVSGLLGDGTIGHLLFDDLREDFSNAHVEACVQARRLNNWLAGLLDALERKRENVIVKVEYEIGEAPIVDGSVIKEILTIHNGRVGAHAEKVKAAAHSVELHLLKEAETYISELGNDVGAATSEIRNIRKALDQYRNDLAILESGRRDPLPSADVMTTELARILGRSELSFELLGSGQHYRVTRHGKPARDLSTGERTAITLIHFLQKVKLSDLHSGKAIVVIDDPVSSLDSNSALGISTYIWSEVVSGGHIRQAFLMTHNFELFRQWDIQIDGLPSPKKGKLPLSDKQYVSSRYEIVAPHRTVDGAITRVPKFLSWPPDECVRQKVRSSYHHAFIVATRAYNDLSQNASMEAKLDAQLLYPNLLRRILETFLAFKNPFGTSNFTGSMREAADALVAGGFEGDANVLRLHLTRFTHAYSHAESPETNVVVNPDEMRAAIGAVFTFMNAIDRRHFEGLCRVVGAQASELLSGA